MIIDDINLIIILKSHGEYYTSNKLSQQNENIVLDGTFENNNLNEILYNIYSPLFF
jgi:hypothetical protein